MKQLTSLLLIPILVFVLGAWSCNNTPQTWLNLAQQDIPILAQEAVAIATLVAPGSPDIPLINQVSAAAVAGVTTVSDALAAYQANPNATTLQDVVAAIDKVSTDLPALLATLPFKDANTAAIITAAVDGIVVVLDIIVSQIPAQSSISAAHKAARAARLKKAKASVIPTPAEIAAAWNLNVCHNDFTHCKKM